MFRRLFIVFMMVILSSVSSYGSFEFFSDLISKGKSITKIGESLGIFSEKDAKHIRRNLQMTKYYAKSNTKEIVYDTLPETTQNDYRNLKEIQDEIGNVLGREVAIQSPSWMEVNLIDLYKKKIEVKDDYNSDSTNEKIKKVNEQIDKTDKSIGSSQMAGTVFSGQQLQENYKTNDKLNHIATTLTNMDEKDNLKQELEKKKSEEEKSKFSNFSKKIINLFSLKKVNKDSTSATKTSSQKTPLEISNEMKEKLSNIPGSTLKKITIKYKLLIQISNNPKT